jgi:hypothetical protein
MEHNTCPHCVAERHDQPAIAVPVVVPNPELIWLDTPAAAKELGLAPQTLTTWRCRKLGPPYARVGGRIRYNLHQIRIWRENQLVATA